MNYMKAKKANSNRSFRTMAEYISHIDAYARNTKNVKGAPTTEANKTPDERRRAKYAKLLA